MALDHLCHPKNQGGLGFMHLRDFNQALLSKAVWRFLVDKDSLCVQKPPRNAKWTRPEYGPIKVNCDSAIGENNSYIAIVARDWRGALVFALSKRVETNVPVQVEAEAINWATQLAVE
uniref:RNase H type-1 domain-containing protein n=1 Tax=Quercus lobata TaxID=97700 RepID=A0A7N2RE27_QUELO